MTQKTSSKIKTVVLVAKDYLGDGDRGLSTRLLAMALYAFSQAEELPTHILMMNSGVKLAADRNGEAASHLLELAGSNVEILTCGTCLEFYGVKDDQFVGRVSNMYELVGIMTQAQNVNTL